MSKIKPNQRSMSGKLSPGTMKPNPSRPSMKPANQGGKPTIVRKRMLIPIS